MSQHDNDNDDDDDFELADGSQTNNNKHIEDGLVGFVDCDEDLAILGNNLIACRHKDVFSIVGRTPNSSRLLQVC